MRDVVSWVWPVIRVACGRALGVVCGMMVVDVVSGSDSSFEWPFAVPTR